MRAVDLDGDGSLFGGGGSLDENVGRVGDDGPVGRRSDGDARRRVVDGPADLGRPADADVVREDAAGERGVGNGGRSGGGGDEGGDGRAAGGGGKALSPDP